YCVSVVLFGFIVTDVAAPSTVSLHDALPIFHAPRDGDVEPVVVDQCGDLVDDTVRGSAQFGVSVPDIDPGFGGRPCLAHDTEGGSEEHTSELQSRFDLVCRPLLEKQQE